MLVDLRTPRGQLGGVAVRNTGLADPQRQEFRVTNPIGLEETRVFLDQGHAAYPVAS